MDTSSYPAWVPDKGMANRSALSNVDMAAALEVVRRRVCAYGGVDPCDCKKGAAEQVEASRERLVWTAITAEKTGCYELRAMIHDLLESA